MTFVENTGALLLFTPVSLVFSAKTDDRLSPGQSNLSYPIPEYPAADISVSLAMIKCCSFGKKGVIDSQFKGDKPIM